MCVYISVDLCRLGHGLWADDTEGHQPNIPGTRLLQGIRRSGTGLPVQDQQGPSIYSSSDSSTIMPLLAYFNARKSVCEEGRAVLNHSCPYNALGIPW